MTTPSDSLLGKTFDGYRIEKPLGKGGMARVYRALDVKLKRYVAIKVIARNLAGDPGYAERFEREAQAIARLEHSNIVHVYRFGEVDGLYYIAMQYIDGANLSVLIQDYRSQGEVMPIGDTVRVVKDIGAALDFAHSRDVIHRDVKSGNIMVDQEGRALLTDFGIALMGDVGTRGEALGSPYFIAPEQAVSSANAVPQSDLYSLGVTLFQMLTGELPFEGGDAMTATLRAASEPTPPPSRYNAALPASIDDVVLRAMEKDPYDRFSSGAEMSAALEQAVAGWKSGESAKSGPSRRPSLVLLPQKVRAQMQAEPIPAPVPPPTVPSPTRPAATSEVPAAQPVYRTQTSAQATVPHTASASRWRGPLIFAIVVFLAGAVAILISRRPAAGPTELDLTAAAALDASPTQGQDPVTVTPEPSATGTPTPTATPSPTATPAPPILLPTSVAPPTATFTLPAPTLLPASPTVAATATDRPTYELLFARRNDDSLLVVNRSSGDFPLGLLRVGDRGGVDGEDWRVDALGVDECVAVVKDSGNPRMPDVDCTRVGRELTREGRDRFWTDEYVIYFRGDRIGSCDTNSCTIRFR